MLTMWSGLLLAACLLNSGFARKTVEVETNSGTVSGVFIDDDRTDAEYYAFKCIPYAKAPVGDLRFKAPVPVEKKEGIINTQACSMCPQIDFFTNTFAGSEDCLTINVYTRVNPKYIDRNEPLPVIAYIHDSAWREETAGEYNPSYFMENDHAAVILVTFNYRLCPFGFLSTGDAVIPGNNGLKDQVLALKWIKENIRAIGGNPNKVTIVGSSTGAVSVRLHMLSSASKGLFVGAIAQSGNELNTWSLQSNSEAYKLFRKLANDLNCDDDSNVAIVNCLNSKSAEEIIASDRSALANDYNKNFMTTFKPVVEAHTDESFLCKHPLEILKNGERSDVPLIIGLMSNEGGYKYVEYFKNNKLDEMYANLDRLVSDWNVRSDERDEIVSRIRKFYFPKHIREDAVKYRDSFINLISDSSYLRGHNEVIEMLLTTKSAPVYQYINSFKGDHSFTEWEGYEESLAPSHYDDEMLFFDPENYFENYVPSERNRAMTCRLMELWTNFAIYQNPTPNNGKSNLKWKPVSSINSEYLNIIDADNLEMESNFNYKRAEFWRNLANDFGQ